MIIPDVNLLVFAYNAQAPHHAEARRWWHGLLNGEEPEGLPWAVSTRLCQDNYQSQGCRAWDGKT